jgi:hypothetical protein
MIVVLEDGADLAVRRVGLFDRLKSRLRASGLDRELANGASPDSSVALALRARELAQPRQGRRLADALDRIVADADPSMAVRPRVPIDRGAIRSTRGELRTLAGRLRSEPFAVQAIAKLENLIADGSSPLYRTSTSRDLRCEVAEVLALQLPGESDS